MNPTKYGSMRFNNHCRKFRQRLHYRNFWQRMRCKNFWQHLCYRNLLQHLLPIASQILVAPYVARTFSSVLGFLQLHIQLAWAKLASVKSPLNPLIYSISRKQIQIMQITSRLYIRKIMTKMIRITGLDMEMGQNGSV